ncbi:dihydroneopterin aldolase [Campylobacter concisus]
MKFQTVIGMFDFERVAKQEVKVSLEFRSTSLIDYVLVADFIKEFYNEMKFQSVEESLEATCKALKRGLARLLA